MLHSRRMGSSRPRQGGSVTCLTRDARLWIIVASIGRDRLRVTDYGDRGYLVSGKYFER